MDTPDRNQKQSTPSSKVEDSPVFNFINSLSPIKPVKSTRINQIFTSLNFSSPPSIFSSPHVSSNRESRFLRRHQSPDPSNSKHALQNENNAGCSEEASAQLYDNSAELQDNLDTPGKQFKTVIELPITLKYLHGIPDGNATSCCDTASELVGTSKALVPVVCETSEKVFEDSFQEMCRAEQKVEGLGADWDSLISSSADVFMFSSPDNAETFRGLMQKHLDSEASIGTSNVSGYPQDDINYVQAGQVADQARLNEQHESEGPFLQHRESIDLAAVEPTHGNLAISDFDTQLASSLSENTENEPVSLLHRCTRRRCLDFEMVGSNGYVESNGSNASSYSQSDEKVTFSDELLVSVKPVTDTSRCALPGIGLHLNAVGTTSKEYIYMKHEASGKLQPKLNSTISSYNASSAERDSLNKSLASTSSERGIQVAENGIQLAEQASDSLTNEECNPISPTKKRRKVEAAGEPEVCKRCNCKKSKCLKLYCECFAAGVYCIEPCSCQGCFNKPIHEETVLATRKQIESRNPLAFAPKVIRRSDITPDIGDESSKTPTSARHKRGCNCKKSNCLKKYCECYQGGAGCSINCRCEGCKNVFGRKDGSALIGTHAEPEVEAETHEMTEMNKSLQKPEIQESEEQLMTSTHATTPLQLDRPLVQLPFLSNGRPPRTSSFIIGSSSGLYVSHKQPQPRFENQLQSVPENEMPEVLQDNHSPGSGVKTASPNRKRVSPPSCDSGSSPARRSGRKLILQSIPSFPSLSQH